MKNTSKYIYAIVGFALGAALFSGAIAIASSVTATPSNDRVYVNGQEINAQVYKIDGANYFKLRDIAGAVDFSVAYDGRQQRVLIDPSKPYDPNEQPYIAPYVLLNDDGAPANAFKDMALMGMYNNGVDGSVTMNLADTGVPAKIGDSSMKFTYTPSKDARHWSGIAMLWGAQDWKGKGPDLKGYGKLTFWVCGNGGTVKFFIEGDGSAQKSAIATVGEEWQKVTIEVGNWEYINIPFGWACNEQNPSADGATITFWVDGLQFE